MHINKAILLVIIFAWFSDLSAQGDFQQPDTEKYDRKLNKIITSQKNAGKLIPAFDYSHNPINIFRSENTYENVVWKELGPFEPVSGLDYAEVNGNGRINDIEIDPFNPQRILVGSASGGLWETYDEGKNWAIIPNTDMYSLSVSDIEFSQVNTGEIYVATGDPHSLQQYYSAGILKTTDNGVSWLNINPFELSSKTLLNDIELIENSEQIILAASSKGLFISIDGGQNWTTELVDVPIVDIEITNDPDNPIIYLSGYDYYKGNSSIYRSKDLGKSFQTIKSYSNVENTEIAVGKVNNNLYALSSDRKTHRMYELIYSEDEGETWQKIADSSGIYRLVYNQGFYNLVLETDPVNPDVIYAGGVYLFKSTDHGKSWMQQKGLHVDQHDLAFLSDTIALSANDGGIYKSTGEYYKWDNISQGLGISQIYGFSVHPLSSNIINIGTQDNGLIRYSFGNYSYVVVGDGMQSVYDKDDIGTIYYTMPRGNMIKITNDIPEVITPQITERKPWESKIINSEIFNGIVTGYINICASNDQGQTWQKLTDFTDTLEITAIEEYNDTLYFAKQNKLFIYTENRISDSLTFVHRINTIKYNVNNNSLIVGLESFENDTSIVSIKGNIITDISYQIPKVNINTVEIWNKKIIAGTDAGIYIYASDSLKWQYFGENFPAAIVNSIYFDPIDNRIIASTFGRGLWMLELSECSGTLPEIEYTNEKICQSDTINMEVADPCSECEYTWWDGSKGITKDHIFSRKGSTEIFVRKKDENNCYTYSEPLEISIYAHPQISIYLLSNNPVCEGNAAVLYLKKEDEYIDYYSWSDDSNSDTLKIYESGIYFAKYVTPDGCVTRGDSIEIIVNELPEKPVIEQDGIRLIASEGSRHVWYRNLEKVENEKGRAILINKTGTYKVRVYNDDGCFQDSENYLVDVLDDESGLKLEVSPNPVEHTLTLELLIEKKSELSIKLFDILGNEIKSMEYKNIDGYFAKSIELSAIAPGLYYLQVKSGLLEKTTKIIKIK